MNENIYPHEIHTEMESGCKMPTNWLRLLFCFHAVSLAVSVISDLFRNDTWLTWVSRGIMAGIVICLFQLSPANLRYRRSAILKAVRLCLTLVLSLVLSPIYTRLVMTNSESSKLISAAVTVLNLAGLVLYHFAAYQEYHGHADMAAEADPKLARNWRGLFISALALAVLSTAASYVAIQLFAMGEITVAAVNVISKVILVIERVLELLYLWYLYRMIRLFQN